MLSARRVALALLSATASSAVVFGAACGLSVTGRAPATDGHEDAALPTDDAPIGAPVDGALADAAGDGPIQVVPCPEALPGPAMVASPAGDFCIDSTETTVGQYDAFLDATAGDAGFLGTGAGDGGPPPGCLPWMPFAPAPPVPGNSDRRPVRNVSWCDAYAYCAWAGKHLCGGEPDAGGGVASAWFRACTDDGREPYPYGQTDDLNACVVTNDLEPNDVASRATCDGGYGGVFDMVGNVSEWVDACDVTGMCMRAGGFWIGGAAASCATMDPLPRQSKNSVAGIRCCR